VRGNPQLGRLEIHVTPDQMSGFVHPDAAIVQRCDERLPPETVPLALARLESVAHFENALELVIGVVVRAFSFAVFVRLPVGDDLFGNRVVGRPGRAEERDKDSKVSGGGRGARRGSGIVLENLNLRPVAAATAQGQHHLEFLTALAGFVLHFSGNCFGSRRERLRMHQSPGDTCRVLFEWPELCRASRRSTLSVEPT